MKPHFLLHTLNYRTSSKCHFKVPPNKPFIDLTIIRKRVNVPLLRKGNIHWESLLKKGVTLLPYAYIFVLMCPH